MVRRYLAVSSILAGLLGGCGGAGSGTRVAVAPPAAAPIVAEVTTFEAGGLRVLWNGPVQRGAIEEIRGLSAEDPSELDALWETTGMLGPPPRVDFSREVVFAFPGPGGVCPRAISHASLDRAGVLRFSGPPWSGSCVDLLTRVATVVAVPRRLLGSEARNVTIALDSETAFRFRAPVQPAEPNADSRSPVREIDAPAVSLGDVPVPERGQMKLSCLANGTEVWVVHHRDGELDILSAVVATRDTNFFELRAHIEDALLVAPAWDREEGRFRGGYDAHGRNVHGWAPMQRYRYVPSGAGRVGVVGPSAPTPNDPILPPEAAPSLDGPAAPYTRVGRRLLTEFSNIREGDLELLSVDVVWGLSGRARLCRAPAGASGGRRFSGCKESDPIVASSLDRERRAVLVLEGPLLVQRLGPRQAEVIVSGAPNLRVVGARP